MADMKKLYIANWEIQGLEKKPTPAGASVSLNPEDEQTMELVACGALSEKAVKPKDEE